MKICLIAYKIDPVAGSENATGYHLVREIIQKYPDATLISRHDHIAILRNDPTFADVKLVGVDVPKALSFYKRQSRGIVLYYYIWQYLTGKVVHRLDKMHRFDVIHQINFHTDWAPHFIKSATARIVWGPLVHHPSVPISWFGRMPLEYCGELAKRLVKRAFWYCNPALRRAIRRSDIIIFGNPSLPAPYKKYPAKIRILPYAGCHWPIVPQLRSEHGFHLVFAGRLIPLKGPHLALDAFAYFLQHCPITMSKPPSLTIVGSGPLQASLQSKADDINQKYGPVVTLQPWLSREMLQAQFQQADYCLYPSLESQGLVVSEAISQFCAPITLAATGPAYVSQLADLTVTPAHYHYKAVVEAMGQKLITLYHTDSYNPVKLQERADNLRWDVIARAILMFYDRSDV